MNIQTKSIFQNALHELKNHQVSEPELSAKYLLAAALSIEPKELQFYEKDLSVLELETFQKYIGERLKHKPVAYIIGQQNFRGLDFIVNKHVLIPRPETEELVSFALSEANPQTLAIDIGTGSGNIPICLAKEGIWKKVYGFDVSREAIDVAKENALRLEADVAFEVQDVTSDEFKTTLENLISKYSPSRLAITANLPYISSQERDMLEKDVIDFEPHLALFGGKIGDEMIRVITKTVWEVCRAYSVPFFMIHELDDQMVDQVQEHLEGITKGISWNIIRDLEDKRRFLSCLYKVDKN